MVRKAGRALAVGLLSCLVMAGCAVPTEPSSSTGATEERDVTDAAAAYGAHPDQVADLRLPDGAAPASGWPVVVLVHGGFWRDQYRRDLMADLAADAVTRGYAAWNIEYRRVGGAGGWPATFEDTAAAVDHLATLEATLDLDAVAVVGHSAGGQLALWAAARDLLPSDAPGSAPRVRVCAAVGLAPVADLAHAEATGVGSGAVAALLGGSSRDHPRRWATADPSRLVGHGIPVLLVHTVDDESVPYVQSERYAEVARGAGDPVELVADHGGHMSVIEPSSRAWRRSLAFLDEVCGPVRGP